MNKSIELLIKLQEELSEQKKLEQENLEIPLKIEQLQENLASAKAKLEEAEKNEKENLSARVRLEDDVKLAEQKKAKSQEQLMSVKDNIQYKATVTQIEFIEKEIGKFEEQILELMEQEEPLNQAVKDAKKLLEEDNNKLKEQEKILLDKKADNEKKLKEISKIQEELRPQIEPDLLSRFDRLSSKPPWLGIAGVRDNRICLACNFTIRPQVLAEIMHGEIINVCDNCQRIIYYIPPEIDD